MLKTDLDAIRLYVGVATFAISTFTGMLLLASHKERVFMTLTLAAVTVLLMLLMWVSP